MFQKLKKLLSSKAIVKTDGQNPKEEKKKQISSKPQIPLNLEMIKKYINPNVTDQEAFMFLQLCKSQNLNPFIKEAHLIKYGTGPATMVVGKDVFTKRANHRVEYNGTDAGIIILNKDKILERRDGSFYQKSTEVLVGGWAKTFRKDREHPFVSEVSMDEYAKPSSGKPNSWNTIPATMIRKVALVQSLREAFPDDFQGLYDAAEMGIELTDKEAPPDVPKNVTPEAEKVDEPKKEDKHKSLPKPRPYKGSVRKNLIEIIWKLCKEAGCKTAGDARDLAGMPFDSDETIPVERLDEIREEIKKRIEHDKELEKKAKKVEEVD